MKKQTSKRILAVLGLLLIVFCVEQAASYFVLPLTNLVVPKTAERAQLNGQITGVLLGSSLTADGVDPRVLDERMGGLTFNMATNAQTMRLTYYALSDVLAENPIERAVIEVSINRMTRDAEEGADLAKVAFSDYLTDRGTIARFMLDQYSVDDVPSLLMNSVRCGLKFFVNNPLARFTPDYYEQYLRQGYAQAAASKVEYAGQGFYSHQVRMHEGGIGARQENPEDGRDVFTTDEGKDNLLELRRIIALCRERGVEPTLIVVPCSNTWQMFYLDSYDDVYRYLQQVAAELDVAFYDFNLSKYLAGQLNDTHFKDVKHMNKYGAALFSDYLAEVLDRGAQPDDFYASFAEAMAHVDRVAGISIEERHEDGAHSVLVNAHYAPHVEPEYRYYIRPANGAKADYALLQDYAPEAEFNLDGIGPGHYILRAEARAKDHPERAYDAFARIELTIK